MWKSEFNRIALGVTCLVALIAGPSIWGQAPRDDRDLTVEGLAQLLEEALANNPLIREARHNADARQALERPAGALPDPVVRLETMGDPLPLVLQSGDPSSGRALSIMQEIPFPGKRRLQQRMAASESAAEGWNYELTLRQVVQEVKLVYYRRWLARSSRRVVLESRKLLEQVAQIAAARYEVGEGNQQDVLRAQVEATRLLDQVNLLALQEETAAARISSLLYRPGGTPVGPPEEVRATPFEYSVAELHRLAQEGSPELQMQRRMLDRNQWSLQLARKQLYPDFEAGFTYVNRSQHPEMFGWMVGAKIPLYAGRKQRPEVNAAASQYAASESRYQWLQAKVFLELEELVLSLENSKRLMQLYGEGLIPQATLALEAAVAAYQVGSVDFAAVVDNLNLLLDYRLRFQEVLAEHESALAGIEVQIGAELAN